MLSYRKRLRQPVPLETLVHDDFQPNPIRHYRMGLDCTGICNADFVLDKTVKTKLDKEVSGSFTNECSSLRRVRNSGGSASQRPLSNSEYLKKRAMTYDQKKYHYAISDADTNNNKYSCMNSADTSCCTTWKPSNHNFVQDGGVSSSTYLNRVKYNNIQVAAKSLSNFDHATVVAHAYSGRPEAPFTLKSKRASVNCSLFKRNGGKYMCNK
jgi:hypothetical protein